MEGDRDLEDLRLADDRDPADERALEDDRDLEELGRLKAPEEDRSS